MRWQTACVVDPLPAYGLRTVDRDWYVKKVRIVFRSVEGGHAGESFGGRAVLPVRDCLGGKPRITETLVALAAHQEDGRRWCIKRVASVDRFAYG